MNYVKDDDEIVAEVVGGTLNRGSIDSHVHKQADRQRFREDRAEERFFLPNPEATRALSLGQQTMVSDFFGFEQS